jgi:hypothetical protein
MTFDGSTWRTNGVRYAPYISVQLQADNLLKDISYVVEGEIIRVIPVGLDGVFPGGRCLSYNNNEFNSIWQWSTTNVMAAGTGVYRFDGAGSVRNATSWKFMTGSLQAEGIHGDSLSNVYAVGSVFSLTPGRIWHYDGNAQNSWTLRQITEARLHDVWVSGDFAVAVGEGIFELE